MRSSVLFTIAILSGCSSLRHQPLGTEADAGALPVSAAPDSRVESAEPSLDDRPDAHAPGESLRDAGAEEAGRADAADDAPHLDSRLAVPPTDAGAPCSNIGSLIECGSIQTCRIATLDSGRCESCANCGNLNAPCSTTADCDILFTCFRNRCTAMCELGSSYCGDPNDCLPIGHATFGVCDPSR